MTCNSFGRKIKDCFSVTFKKDEQEQKMKVWLNEQAVPVAYLKELILRDMQQNKSVILTEKNGENHAFLAENSPKNNKNQYKSFDFNMEEE